MMLTYIVALITFNLFQYSHSLQSGYTCEPSVVLTCPESKSIVILEVTYSSECPKLDEQVNGTSIYAPSRCIAYYRDRANTQCNGKQKCIIDNSPDQRPSFLIGKQANCAFKAQSINIEYSCIPNWNSDELPRVNICSAQDLKEIKEGFIHTPNYPQIYPNRLSCSKAIAAPPTSHRLKIYALQFDITNGGDDWLEINENGERFTSKQKPYTLLFDDVIGASLTFQSNFINSRRLSNGFLLYFIVTPIRRSKSSKKETSTDKVILEEESTILIQEKSAARVIHHQEKNNVGLILLVILLSGALFTIICAFFLYKRRNDRRVRYLTETFHAFLPKRSKSVTLDSSESSDQMDLKSKVDLLSSSNDSKFEHIYSEDPLDKKDSSIYEVIDDEIVNRPANPYFTLNEKKV